jgi:hypothetical protein
MRAGKAMLAGMVLVLALRAWGQSVPVDAATTENEQKARAALQAMVQALGGDTWLNLKNSYLECTTSGFYHGNPTGAIADIYLYHSFPDKDRIELGKKHDAFDFFVGNEGWEVTYRGKKPVPKDQMDDFMRRREHSIEVAMRVWMKDPKTVLIFDKQTMVERHLADQVTLISTSNDSITIQMDAQTHLPLARSWKWRDPLYKDLNTDAEEYDDYHPIQGIATPYSVTRFHNGEEINERYLKKASYNVTQPPDLFDVDAMVAKVKK